MTQPTPPRNPIALLPDGLVNKIAAGEVVERPASVVKELLENAIDAGASRISIAIEQGGKALIRIVDDGTGIPPDEIPLAFAQHATSKIRSTDDLFAIATMGFRGEALASIASVSHATMITRTASSPQGHRAEVKDSHLGPITPCAAPVGTTLEIRDLFYSVPARRKFLRSDAAEFAHIHEMVLRSALPNPHIAITLTHNNRPVLQLAGTADHRLRVSEALGREMHDALLPVNLNERGIAVTGFAGQPALARATAKYQYVFLNGRFIRDRSILHAVKEAYRGLIEPSSQPVAVLFLQMDPAAFDVNVHPQKTEVRFRDSAPYGIVLAAIRERLLASDLTPQVRTAGRTDAPPQSRDTAAADTRQIIADFFKQPPAPQPRLTFTDPHTPPAPSPLEDPSRITLPSPPTPRDVPTQPNTPSQPPQRWGGNTAHPLPPPAPTPASPPASPLAPAESPSRFIPPPDRSVLAAPHAPRFVQLHNTYIVAQTAEGILIIDQHALHERILYEELFTRVTRGPLEGQRLLIPDVLPVNPRQQAALEQVQPLLARLGIETAPFDAASIAIHSFPSLLAKVNPREFLRDLLDKLQESAKLPEEEMLHEVLDMASCKAAVKAGYPLTHDEIAALLARKDQVDRSSNCPHGRPTTLRLTLNDLERQFKRK